MPRHTREKVQTTSETAKGAKIAKPFLLQEQKLTAYFCFGFVKRNGRACVGSSNKARKCRTAALLARLKLVGWA